MGDWLEGVKKFGEIWPGIREIAVLIGFGAVICWMLYRYGVGRTWEMLYRKWSPEDVSLVSQSFGQVLPATVATPSSAPPQSQPGGSASAPPPPPPSHAPSPPLLDALLQTSVPDRLAGKVHWRLRRAANHNGEVLVFPDGRRVDLSQLFLVGQVNHLPQGADDGTRIALCWDRDYFRGEFCPISSPWGRIYYRLFADDDLDIQEPTEPNDMTL